MTVQSSAQHTEREHEQKKTVLHSADAAAIKKELTSRAVINLRERVQSGQVACDTWIKLSGEKKATINARGTGSTTKPLSVDCDRSANSKNKGEVTAMKDGAIAINLCRKYRLTTHFHS